MPTYIVPFSIDGEMAFEAESATEAELKFMQLGKREIAEMGCLVTYAAETAEAFEARKTREATRRNDLPADVEAHR